MFELEKVSMAEENSSLVKQVDDLKSWRNVNLDTFEQEVQTSPIKNQVSQDEI
jgi:hypothetical protein